MCGRYAASRHADQLVEMFEVDEVVDPTPDPGKRPWTQPSWNVAPTDEVPVVLTRRPKDDPDQVWRKLVGLRWGLVPSWAKDPSQGARLINARLETVAEKPSFRKAFSARRCLVPADGYYEWYASPNAAAKTPKQPFYIHPKDSPVMVMAGIYEFWRNPAAEPGDPQAWLSTCSIITTSAADDLGMIHDRMPVQVLPEHWDDWLDPDLTDAGAALGLVHVPQPGQMSARAVSRLVSSVRNDGPELVQPIEVERA